MKPADIRKTLARRITEPLMPILSKSRLTPDNLTWIGLVINIVAAGFLATGHLVIGGLLVLVSGFFDILDGALARFTQRITRFGALLDSTFDRLSEAVLFLGLLALYITNDGTVEIYLIFLAMIGSFLTSYIRARAEGLGMECQVGLFTRAGRVIILALGLLLNQVFIALAIVVALGFVTVGQRLVYTWQQSKGKHNKNTK